MSEPKSCNTCGLANGPACRALQPGYHGPGADHWPEIEKWLRRQRRLWDGTIVKPKGACPGWRSHE